MKLRVLFGVFGVALGISASAQTALTKKLDRYSSSVTTEFDNISAERKEKLSSIADMILSENLKEGKSSVVFTDENNSGTSQLAQVLFQVAVVKNNLTKVNVYSAGLSESNIDKNSIVLLKNAGFIVESNTTFKNNPRYLVNYSWNDNRIMLFSKKMNNFQIPTEKLMVVNLSNTAISESNNENINVSLTYGQVNEETFGQIAREMFFVAEKIRNNQLLSHNQ